MDAVLARLSSVEASEFCDAVKGVAAAAVKGAALRSRPVLGLVKVTVLPDGLRFEATDTYLAARVEWRPAGVSVPVLDWHAARLFTAAELVDVLPPKSESKRPAGAAAGDVTTEVALFVGADIGRVLRVTTSEAVREVAPVDDPGFPDVAQFFDARQFDDRVSGEPRLYDPVRLGQVCKIVGAAGKGTFVDMMPGPSGLAPTTFVAAGGSVAVSVVLMPVKRKGVK